MDEAKRGLDLRAVLGVLAVVLAAATVWAASAMATNGSASGEPGTRDSPTAATVQNEGEAPDDCPNRGGESESTSGV